MITVSSIVALLNDLHASDPDAMHALIRFRFPCAKAIVDHPSVICGGEPDDPDVSWLGILNGIVGRQDRIASVMQDGKVIGFRALDPFEIALVDRVKADISPEDAVFLETREFDPAAVRRAFESAFTGPRPTGDAKLP